MSRIIEIAEVFLASAIIFIILKESNNQSGEIQQAGFPTLISVVENSTVKTDETYLEMYELYSILKELGVRYPRVVLSQSVLETDYFSSNICVNNRNYFGMKHNSRGFSTKGLPTCSDAVHGCYQDRLDSVLDYLSWQKVRLRAYETKYGKVTSEEEYLRFLDNLVINGKTYRYAEDPLYTKSLRRLLKTPDFMSFLTEWERKIT